MKILHYKESMLANAPDQLVKCLRRYTDLDVSLTSAANELRDADLIHYHVKYRKASGDIPYIIQYHSEPFRADFENIEPKESLVVAQYQMLLDEYKHCKPIRNIIDIENPLYNYKAITDKIRVGFSPWTNKAENQYYDKGFDETVDVLKRLKSKYPDRFDFDVIRRVQLDECIERKSLCNMLIDECKTGSYHRNTLEGLALGRVTVCYITEELQDKVKELYGDELPVANVHINDLEYYLEFLCQEGNLHGIAERGRSNKIWMEKYWHPKDICKEFVDVYERVLS